MIDLSTTYLGLKLKNPIVASSSPLSRQLDNAHKMEEAGIAAIVMYSLFEEQIIRESLKLNEDLTRGTEQFAEALTYIPEVGVYSVGPDSYIKHLKGLKKAVNIPVIGSLNGSSTGGWIEYAQKIEDGGSDALELNIYYLATDPRISSNELEDTYVKLVKDIRKKIKIPLAVKLSPFHTSLPHFAKRLVDAGVNGLVLFNRFYQPDFDLEAMEVVPNLVYSSSQELRLPLRWIAILYGRVKSDFALTSGVHTGDDTLKAIMAGASVCMIASEFLVHGISQIKKILADITIWMQDHEYVSISQMKGSMSQQAVADPAAFVRANYMKVLSSY